MDERGIVESLAAGMVESPFGTGCKTRNVDMPMDFEGPAVVYTQNSEWPEARRTAVDRIVASYLTKEEEALPETAHQSVETKRELYESARYAEKQMSEWLDGMAEKLGLRKCFQVGNEVPEIAKDKDGPILVETPIKDLRRSEDKVEEDYGGDWSRLLDVVRATVAVDREDEIEEILEALRESGMELARKPKDKVEDVGDDGFRAVHLNVALPNGHIGEVQVMVKSLLVARIEMHDCYEAVRELEGARGGRDELDGEELAAVEAIERLMAERYDEAWKEAGGKGRTAGMVGPCCLDLQESMDRWDEVVGRVAGEGSVDVWYDRRTRNWVVETKDARGYQVGDAVYVYTKPEAMREKESIEKEMGIGKAAGEWSYSVRRDVEEMLDTLATYERATHGDEQALRSLEISEMGVDVREAAENYEMKAVSEMVKLGLDEDLAKELCADVIVWNGRRSAGDTVRHILEMRKASRVAVRTKYKKVEPTTPGSKNHYKVTYHDGQEKWVDSVPGRGEPGRRNERVMKHKMNSPAVQTALKSLNTALKKFEKGADGSVLEKVVEKNEVSLDKALSKKVNRLFVRTVKKKEGDGIEDKTKEGLEVVKDHVNRHRKDASRLERIAERVFVEE